MSSPLLFIASAVFAALSVLDLKQTLELQKLGAIENNPLLGKHPKPQVLIAFATVTTALWLGAVWWFASKGVEIQWIAALLAWGIFLRLWVVFKGRKLLAKLKS